MKLNPLLVVMAVMALFIGIAARAAHAATPAGLAINDPALKTSRTLKVSSVAILPNSAIPDVYSSYGKSLSPPIGWGRGPKGTASYALIIEDPDAPLPVPFVHWMLWNINPAYTGFDKGVVPPGARQGKLMYVGTVGYMGPKPSDAAAHHYHFQVFALDRVLDLPDGAERADLGKAMAGHVLAAGELVGTYKKK